MIQERLKLRIIRLNLLFLLPILLLFSAAAFGTIFDQLRQSQPLLVDGNGPGGCLAGLH